MSNYIGNQPAFGEFKKLDSIVSLFNGSTTQFNLEHNSVGHTIGDATQLIVSLNGVIQEPGTAYTLGLGGGSIVFASAPASTDTCHIVSLGGVGGTTTPTDGSVTASKLDSNLKDYLEETFTADGTQTVFTLTRAVIGANTLLVTIDGIVQPSSAFTASGTTLTISEVLAANTNVRVVHMGVKAGVYVPADDSVTADMLANSINTDIAAGVAALPKAGGTMTGHVNGTTLGINLSTPVGIGGSIADLNTAEIGPGYINLARDDTANATQIRFAKNGSLHSYLETRTNGLGFITNVGNFGFEGGNVGIGTSSPSGKLSIEGATATDEKSHITFENTQGAKKFAIGGGKSGVTNNGFAVVNVTDNTAPLLIDDSGNVLVGKTAMNGNTAGIQVKPAGELSVVRDANHSLILNRKSSNGNIALFQKDGSTVGSMGVADGDNIYIASDDTNDVGLKFNGDGNRITPCNALGADRGSAIDLGEANSGLFKDLYLSGGIQFDARSNKLDDYEEGNWTPSILVENAAAAGITVNHATYTKIGRLVSLVFDVTINSVTGTNSSRAIQLEGMPFTINTAYGGGPNIGYTNLTNSMSGNLALQGRLNNRYRIVNLTGATGQNASDHIQATTVLRGQFTYHTDQ